MPNTKVTRMPKKKEGTAIVAWVMTPRTASSSRLPLLAQSTPSGMDTSIINASPSAASHSVTGSLSPISSATGIISFMFLE